MKKNILICAILMMTFCPLSVAQGSESWYRNYFKEHVEELDPIEGIYSVMVRSTRVIGGQEMNDNLEYRVAIKKDGYQYVCKHLDNKVELGSTIFDRIGETREYTMSVKAGSQRVPARVYLDDLFSFNASVKFPVSVIREALPQNMKRYAHEIDWYYIYRFTKAYPTRSMYEEAIAKVQKRIEENSQPSSWSGTGWAIGSNYIVTNNHVTDGARTIKIRGVGGDGNASYTAKVVATDKVNDLAVLKIDDYRFSGFGSIPYAVKSNMAEVGEDVFVLGYPLTQYMGDEIKLTNGIISSRTGYQGDVANYQISAPIQPGNSGGPMFDSKGNVIGIVVAGVPGAENVGYAIKISYLKILIESAGLNITFPTNNTVATLSLAEQVKRVKKFVFYIECSK